MMGRDASSVTILAVVLVIIAHVAKLCECGNSTTTTTIGCIEKERKALLEFKSMFDDPSHLLSSWNGLNCCQWKGISCHPITQHVLKLHLKSPCYRNYSDEAELYSFSNGEYTTNSKTNCTWPANRLQLKAQHVAPSLLQLEYLNYLDLSGNDFNYTSIPMFLGSMRRLQYFSLSDSGFFGRIPHSLGNLSKLHHLDLSWNFGLYSEEDINWVSQLRSLRHLDMSLVNFERAHTVTIPMFLGSMRRLEYLSLSHANFVGRIPHNLGNLSKLHHLDLRSNFGLYSEEDINWVSQLRSLRHLDMSFVNLGRAHNVFQVLNMLPSLSHVYLMDCFDSNLFIPGQPIVNVTNLARLEVLNLAWNYLEARMLNNAFQNMTSLRVLDISFNSQLNIVPFWLKESKSLVELYVRGCSIDSSFPFVLQNLTSIEVLDLSYNSLDGSIPPDALLSMTSISSLNLGSNNFTSMEFPVSSIIRNMCHLKSLDLSKNMFQGEAFEGAYGNASSRCIDSKLEMLDLSYNDFSGSLPSKSWFQNHKHLRTLSLHSNHLNGTIPESLGLLVNLNYLSLSRNNLDGILPNVIGQLDNLQFLYLSNNHFQGVIPTNFGQLVNLCRLDLSDNYFHGDVPINLGLHVNLEYLNLSHNNFHGGIDQMNFSPLQGLQVLDFSNNHMNGSILEMMKLSQMRNLYHLDFSNNNISGSIIEDIGDTIPNLRYLSVANNLVNGSIPNSMCKLEFLASLDLSKNNLSGQIPNCWNGNGYNWYEINLSSNKLSGVFPSSFWNLTSLSWLHLNNNNLQGELPFFMNNALQQLLILDLGENNFSGSIPLWTGNTFYSLQILRLHRNKLNGSIPSQLCQLKSLQILDLADNNLSGPIPRCIGNLTSMTLDKFSSPESSTSSGPTIAEAPESSSGSPPAEAPTPADESAWKVEDVKQVMKGREDDYTRNLKLVVNMDLSRNNLVGSIPKEITFLTKLHGLNLSSNHLEGGIPQMIGNMKSLESLDLSFNQLSGSIPNSMSALSSMGNLNLSYNNLSGPIPTGNQLSTLDDPYRYVGNQYLCGPSLPNKCPNDDSHQILRSKGDEEEEEEDKSEKLWFYFVVAIGFASGFWGAIGTLWYKKSWRHTCFRYVEGWADNIYVAIVIKVEKLKKWKRKNCVRG